MLRKLPYTSSRFPEPREVVSVCLCMGCIVRCSIGYNDFVTMSNFSAVPFQGRLEAFRIQSSPCRRTTRKVYSNSFLAQPYGHHYLS
jgi:hypothetical protein